MAADSAYQFSAFAASTKNGSAAMLNASITFALDTSWSLRS